MFKPLELILKRIVSHGDLCIVTADGQQHRFGNGSPPRVAIALSDARLERQIALNPHLAVGEAYMAGRLQMREGRIYDLIALLLENANDHPLP
ncbi:MAG: SAM-dependent methyltransferase, partial [Proteobacteria bacterium]|nr:SAM-dependent methyltransferase [Pseudomonadota bacterium]